MPILREIVPTFRPNSFSIPAYSEVTFESIWTSFYPRCATPAIHAFAGELAVPTMGLALAVRHVRGLVHTASAPSIEPSSSGARLPTSSGGEEL